MNVGDIIEGTITGVISYGIFVSYQEYQGLIHVSEVSDQFIADLTKLFNPGEQITAMVIALDTINQKLQLSYKKTLNINPTIIKKGNIKIGFHTLKNTLPKWISKAIKGDHHGNNT